MEPLWKVLGGDRGRVRVYASGINPDRPQDVVATKYAEGFRSFKLKVGFGEARDVENARNLKTSFMPDMTLMLDAN